MHIPPNTRKIILVEGTSDQAAVETLAQRYGCHLHKEHIVIIPVNGAANFRHFVKSLGPLGQDIALGGLIDVAETDHLLLALHEGGFDEDISKEQLAQHGFFVCDVDLEDELIRAVGTEAILALFEEQDEARSFRKMQAQPVWRERSLSEQIRRFIGVKSGRKRRYGQILTANVDLADVPPPLAALISSL